MDGGQKAIIDLNSNLDIKTSDMLVNVSDATLAHNRQRYQGHYLPTSLRYEHDGWAVDNDVYQFTFDSQGVDTSPKEFYVIKRKLGDNPNYLIVFQKDSGLDSMIDYAQLWWNKSSSSLDTSVDVLEQDEFSTFKSYISDKAFEVKINSLTGEVTVSNDFSANVETGSNGRSTITVTDDSTKELFSLVIHTMQDMYNGEEVFATQAGLTNNTYTWNGDNEVTYVADASDITVNGTSVPVTKSGNTLTGTYKKDYTGTVKVPLSSNNFYQQINSLKITDVNDKQEFPVYSNVVAQEDFEYFQIKKSGSVLSNSSPILLSGYVPLWCGLNISHGINATLQTLIQNKQVASKTVGDITAGLDLLTFYKSWSERLTLFSKDVNTWDAAYWDVFKKKSLSVSSDCETLEVNAGIDVCKIPDAELLDELNFDDTLSLEQGYYKHGKYGYIDSTGFHSYLSDDTDPDAVELDGFYDSDGNIDPKSYSNLFDEDFYNEGIYGYIGSDGNITSNKVSSDDIVKIELRANEKLTYAYATTLLAGQDDLNKVYKIYCSDASGNSLKWRWHNNTVFVVSITGSNYARFSVTDGILAGLTYTCSFIYATRSLLVSSEGAKVISTETIYSKQADVVSDATLYAITSIPSAVVYTECFKGYFESTLSMDPVILATTAPTQVKLTKVPDSSLSNPSRYYCDRARPGYVEQHIIDLSLDSVSIVAGTSKDASVSITVVFKSVDDVAATFYAELKSQSESGEKEKYDFYVPGYIYSNDLDSIGKNYGHLKSSSFDDLKFYLKGTSTGVKRLTGYRDISWSDNFNTGHTFFTTLADWKNSIKVTIADITFFAQTVTVSFGGYSFSGLYDATTESLIISGGSTTLSGYNVTVTVTDADKANIGFTVAVPLDFNLSVVLPYINTVDVLKKIEASKYIIEHNGASISADLGALEALYRSKKFTIINSNPGIYGIDIDYAESITFDAVVRGPYRHSNLIVKSFQNDILTVTIDGKDYSIDLSDKGLFNSSLKSNMQFLYTDVTDPDLQQNLVAEVDPDNEYQFLKQQWDTDVSTENFWWIDSDHVLALTQTRFILRQKTNELDDWNGDVFEDIQLTNRGKVLDNDTVKYGVSSSYGSASHAYLWKIHNLTANSFVLSILDPLDNLSTVYSLTLKIRTAELQTYLNKDTSGNILNKYLSSYSQLVVQTVISQSKFTSTCVDGYFIFGIHYDNNFNQWAVKVNLNSPSNWSVVQGYGYVGVNGCLTGGEIPSACFDASYGFTKPVLPISALLNRTIDYPDNVSSKFNWETDQSTSEDIKSIRKLFNIADEAELYKIACLGKQTIMVVGNESQQWYITKQLTSIVSHLTWNGSGWTSNLLYLNNNLVQKYGTPSWSKRNLSDFLLWMTTFTDIFPSNNDASTSDNAAIILINTILAVAGYPMIYGMHPKINSVQYLQQTFGQYAYVHYNSSNIRQTSDPTKENTSDNNGGTGTSVNNPMAEQKEKNTLASDDFGFNSVLIQQKCSIDQAWNSVLALCIQANTSAADFTADMLTSNAHDNQMSVEDTSKKFSQFARSNFDAMASLDTQLNGASTPVSSAVSGVLTLDMFYSTSDAQQVQGGAGWVNHNFVAQCVAQSVTSNQMEISQICVTYIMSALTLYQLDLEVKGLDIASAQLHDIADTYKSGQGPSAMGSGTGDLPFKLTSIALQAAAYAVDIVNIAVHTAREVLPSMLEGIGADKMQISTSLKSSKHALDVEAKHNYGSKSECFMWPCFGIETAQSYTDEGVDAVIKNSPWKISVPLASYDNYKLASQVSFGKVYNEFGTVTHPQPDDTIKYLNGDCNYLNVNCVGTSNKRKLPADMAYVIGSDTFLPTEQFRNENIGMSEPVFPTPPFQDYIVDKQWEISQTASVGMTTWVSCKDTKLIDGEPSNFVITDSFCGVASPYTAIEVKKGVTRKYLRPWAVTPSALILNQSGYNCCYDRKAYHAADGYGYRIVNWLGTSGMNKEYRAWMYSFLVNDRFKRSNKMPLNEFIGSFKSDPVLATKGDINDKVYTLTTIPSENKGLSAGTIGEDKDARRYAIPIFTEFVSTLPAVVKTISSYSLSVIDGITTLTTENRDLQSAYKSPVSVDFILGKQLYRYTKEYICTLTSQSGVTIVEHAVPCLGLKFIGTTPFEAYLYSPATKQYYVYTGGTALNVVDMIERFRDVTGGIYDFINQEVVMPCLATFVRLDKEVQDDENETDNIIIPRLKENSFIGEITPPIETIFNTRSWFRTLSLASGITYQGPNRCIINRFVYEDYMLKQIKNNYGLWERVSREEYHPFRKYRAQYSQVDVDIGNDVKVIGWTHNPFLFVTSALGLKSEADCMFEWEITFCWPIEMDKLYGIKNYATVNIWAETMTPGGKVTPERPTHVYLHKELFTRTNNYGYYSFTYQSKCGAGNRERLHIWSDQYICISSLCCEYKQITGKRNMPATQQTDIQLLDEI